MILKDISLATPEENILYDEVLLELAEKGESSDALRFWESSSLFVVLGRISKMEDDVNVDQAIKDSIPICRRSSGGGTVLQGPGCLNYSLILSKEKHPSINQLHQAYSYVLSKIVHALEKLNVHAQYLPISDIALTQTHQKISGNAQKRSRHYILHHGTLLNTFSLKHIESYLKYPKSVPDYRKKRPHLNFVSNLDVDPKKLKNNIKDEFDIKEATNVLSNREEELLQKYLAEKEVLVAP